MPTRRRSSAGAAHSELSSAMADKENPVSAKRARKSVVLPHSPAASEASDVFFDAMSPSATQAGSTTGSPTCDTPSLSGLLHADVCATGEAPALSELINQDKGDVVKTCEREEEDDMMDMTTSVGGLLGRRCSNPDCSENAAAEPVPDDEDETMDMTMAVGGIFPTDALSKRQRMSPQVSTPDGVMVRESDDAMEMTGVYGSLTSSTPDWLRESAVLVGLQRASAEVSEMLVPPPPTQSPPASDRGDAVEFQDAPPVPAARLSLSNSRRFSFSNKLAEVGSRIFRLATTASATSSPSANGDALIAPTDAQGKSSQDPACGYPEPNKVAAPVIASTFDEYLAAAGVAFHDADCEDRRRHTSLGGHKALGPAGALTNDGSAPTLTDKMMAAHVLAPELEQRKWAAEELQKCIGVLQEGYLMFEEYIRQNAEGFFSSPEAQLPPQQLRSIKRQCRQVAKDLWYDWRQTLEEDVANKLQKAAQDFDSDIAHIQTLRSRAAELQKLLGSTVPEPSDHLVNSLSEERLKLSSLSAQREATLVHARSAHNSLLQQVRKAELDLKRLEESQNNEQRRLISLSETLSFRTAVPAESLGSAQRGEELLTTLQASLCWRPIYLKASGMTLRFSDAFDLFATFDPGSSMVVGAELRSLLPQDDRQPHVLALRILLDTIRPSIDAALQGCRTASDISTLMPSLSVRLGRLMDLAREIETVASQVCTEVYPDEARDCVNLLGRCLQYAI
ncbi:hypothetical protein AB1Y20_019232 [Prymnesium parvum]|uniref:Spc7 kinetochore protein domain-containing protein n=1 Tax=Prymnesium parvum TaxID=97485 RepID=A0AB34JTW4_PRYPA